MTSLHPIGRFVHRLHFLSVSLVLSFKKKKKVQTVAQLNLDPVTDLSTEGVQLFAHCPAAASHVWPVRQQSPESALSLSWHTKHKCPSVLGHSWASTEQTSEETNHLKRDNGVDVVIVHTSLGIPAFVWNQLGEILLSALWWDSGCVSFQQMDDQSSSRAVSLFSKVKRLFFHQNIKWKFA